MFDLNLQESVPEREERILRLWKEEDTFQNSMALRSKERSFTFYDGPPFATGLPHYGHILAGTIKDVIPRYKTMQGFYVERRFGWDCHGLPVENEIEKAKGLSGAYAIEEFGIGAFNEECRSIVLRYVKEWESTVERMGRWVSFKDTYKTMDLPFMESVWWVFGELYKKGLVYEGFKVMPFSTKLGTPLSNFEANLNYKEVDDPSLTVQMELVDCPGTFLLVWTTTPWTLPSNVAVMVKGDFTYVTVEELSSHRKYLLAESRLTSYFKDPSTYKICDKCLGKELIGKKYKPLFSYFVEQLPEEAFRVIEEESLSSEDGTGMVHSAPAFGEIDFFACAKAKIPLINPVDVNGKFTQEVSDFVGQYVKEADKEIIKKLKGEGKVFHHGQIRHRYPFCWRSDTPLIYKAVSTWFIAVEKVKEKILAANTQINWVPDHIKQGRFGKWLENARDWAVSRNRYWGTPIPLWKNEEGEILVISSIADLEEKTGQKITDLHRHYIDELTIVHNGKEYRRVKEVFDCWFESGSMPYAQDHYPFENKEKVEKGFPADFIAEGLDQTRGWFYTLTVLGAILFDKPAFKHVIVNGIILAEDGQKMSKRLKNYPEPLAVVNQYGADAVRLYLLNSPVVQAEDFRFSERGVELTLRQALLPLWNSAVFFSSYAKIYQWKPNHLQPACAEIDRWILSILQKLIADVTQALDNYTLNLATEPLIGFIDQLTNWYIRRSRSRFWADEDSKDRQEAFSTLYTVLFTVSQLIAPFTPFLSDAIFRELRQEKDPLSVHLCSYPKAISVLRDQKLEEEMHHAQIAVSLGHALRKENKLKVRQPLSQAFVISSNPTELAALKKKEGLIGEELNVKEVVFASDESRFVSLVIKPNFRSLGKKVGKQMPLVQSGMQQLTKEQIEILLQKKPLVLSLEGLSVELLPEDVEVTRQVKPGLIASSQGSIVIALETHLTEPLLLEGLAREIVNKVNTMRKEMGLQIVDRIQLFIQETPRIKEAFALHGKHILHETLTTKVLFSCKEGEEWDLNGENTKISLQKDS